MKIQPILAFAAVMALSFAAQAHDCSGGASGGMDATGNQCGDEAAYSATSMTSAPAANPSAQFGAQQAQSTGANPVKPVATNARHSTMSSHHATKKYSHRTPKKQLATTG